MWTQTDQVVKICFRLWRLAELRENQVAVVHENDVKITFKPSTLLIMVLEYCLVHCVLWGKVKVEGCTWRVTEMGAELHVTLTKEDGQVWWERLTRSTGGIIETQNI